MHIHKGMKLKEAVKAAQSMGWAVGNTSKAGELSVTPPGCPIIRIDVSRKVAPRVLVSRLRQADHGTLKAVSKDRAA